MFLLDSLMISGLKWVMNTVSTVAEAEMNDDTALREQLLDAEMRRETGEISDQEFGEIETDLLARIREIRERREGGSGPLEMGGAQPIETSPDSKFQVEASVSGDFYEPSEAPHTTIIETEPGYGEQVGVLDMAPGQAEPASYAGLPLSAPHKTRLRRAPQGDMRTASARPRHSSPTNSDGERRRARTPSSKLRKS